MKEIHHHSVLMKCVFQHRMQPHFTTERLSHMWSFHSHIHPHTIFSPIPSQSSRNVTHTHTPGDTHSSVHIHLNYQCVTEDEELNPPSIYNQALLNNAELKNRKDIFLNKQLYQIMIKDFSHFISGRRRAQTGTDDSFAVFQALYKILVYQFMLHECREKQLFNLLLHLENIEIQESLVAFMPHLLESH